MTTIHSYTGDQPTLDTMHKDLYRGRAAALSHDPDLDRRRQGHRPGAARTRRASSTASRSACRPPTCRWSTSSSSPSASDRRRRRSTRRVKLAAANGSSRASSTVPTSPTVSSDFNHDPHSSTFHLDQTKVMDGTLGASHELVRQRVGLFQPHGRHRGRPGQAGLEGPFRLRSASEARVTPVTRRLCVRPSSRSRNSRAADRSSQDLGRQ